MRLLLPSLLLLLSACASTPPVESPAPVAAAPAPTPAIAQPSEHTGTIAGAPWRLDVPENWNGELVVYMHGYKPVEDPIPEVMPRNGYEGWLLERGFAIAQSDYSARGWAVAEALQDTEALRKHVVGLLGQPKRTWAMGHSRPLAPLGVTSAGVVTPSEARGAEIVVLTVSSSATTRNVTLA